MRPEAFVELFGTVRASAILRTELADAVAPAMDAAVRAGFRIVEFTLTTPGALEHIESFAARADLVVGAGTVLTPDDARAAVAAGARYLVSPVVDPAVIEEAARLGVAPAEITFIDDKVNHLDAVSELGVRCALAAWGYNGARERELARERGYLVCTLGDVEATLFDG